MAYGKYHQLLRLLRIVLVFIELYAKIIAENQRSLKNEMNLVYILS